MWNGTATLEDVLAVSHKNNILLTISRNHAPWYLLRGVENVYLYTRPFTLMFTAACWGKEGLIPQTTKDCRPVKLLWILEWWYMCPNPYNEQHQESVLGDFSSGPGVKNFPANAGDTGLISGQGRLQRHGVTRAMCHNYWSPRDENLWHHNKRRHGNGIPCTAMKRSSHSMHWRSNAVKNK